MVSMVTGTREAFQIHHIHRKPLKGDLQDSVEIQQLSVAVAPSPDVDFQVSGDAKCSGRSIFFQMLLWFTKTQLRFQHGNP